MFKSVRWKSEKHKITALYKLRFHATQVSQFGGNELVLSVAPADAGKPTTKLDKYEIRDGCCYWENSIFESVKFIQDPKSGKIHDRVYNCTISTGSSKSSVLAEVSVNIAEYAAAVKAVSASFPLKGTNSGAALHILIQRIEGNGNQRELEEHAYAKINPKHKSPYSHISNCDTEENTNKDLTDEDHLKKRVFYIAELNDNRSASIGSDITLSGSDSSFGLNTPHEHGLVCTNTLLDSITHKQQRTQWELLEAPEHDFTDDSTNSPSDAFPIGRSQLALDHSNERLKSYLILLSRKAEMSDLELQTLRKQIVKERKRGQDLLKEVASLKVERNALMEECEKLKISQKGKDESKYINKLSNNEDPWALLEETRYELNHVKDLNARLQLQLEHVHVPESLEERFLEGQDLSDDEEQKALEDIVRQHTDAKDNYILEQRVMDLCSEIELYRRDKDELEMQMEQLALDYEILKQENHDMSQKLEQRCVQEQPKLPCEYAGSYTTTNELETRLKELEREFKEQSNGLTQSLSTINVLEEHVCNPEHELEAEREQLEVAPLVKVEREQLDELERAHKQKSDKYSYALATIKELEHQIQSLGEELDKQAQGFESDLEVLAHAKVEQEKRAIRAEKALRLTKLKNANTAGMIQEEIKRLSMQMLTMHEQNEKAMTEARELRLTSQHLEESLQQVREELVSVKTDYEAQIYDLHNMLNFKSNQIEEMLNQFKHQKGEEDKICQRSSTELGDLEKGRNQKALVNMGELLVRRERMETGNSEFAVDSVDKKAEKPPEELNKNNEKDMAVLNLQSEVIALKAHCEELKHYLYEDKLEKETLREEVTLLEDELKKDDALSIIKRKLSGEVNDNGNGFRLNHNDGCKPVDSKLDTLANSEVRENGTSLSSSNTKDKYDLLKEMASLRETKASVENELKELQFRYSEMSVNFAEVEGERQMLVMTLRSMKNVRG